jgi:hypothetical protein
MVTAALVAQSAEALRGLNYDKQNWQSIFTGTGNVTVKLPDGSYWTGPAWNSFGSAATKNTGTSKGEVPLLGTLGFGFAQQINNYNQYYDRAIFLATDAPYSWFPEASREQSSMYLTLLTRNLFPAGWVIPAAEPFSSP